MKTVSELLQKNLVGSQPNYRYEPTKSIEITPQASAVMDKLFSRLIVLCSAWRTALPNDEAVAEFKQLWLEELINANIRNWKFIAFALEKVKQEKSPYLPPVFKFIDWCKEGQYHTLGLPSEDELLDRAKKFSRCGGLAWVDKFDFVNDLEYHLLTKLHERAEKAQWGEKEFHQGVKVILAEWAEKLSNGEPIPPRRKQLPKQVKVKATEEQVSAHLAKMKAMFKGNFNERSAI